MKAIILAAGEAKRLRPLTNELPKCLLKVDHLTIFDHQIQSLQECNIKDIVIVVGFHAKKIINHCQEYYPHLNFHFIENLDYSKTYPAYGLWLAREHLQETAIYLNSDVIFHPEIIKSVVFSPHQSATAIQRVPWDEEEVNVRVNEHNEITEIGKHLSQEDSWGEFIGVTKLGANFNLFLTQALEGFIEKKEFQKFAADSINQAITTYGGIMHALDLTHLPAIEIDTVPDYERAKEIMKHVWTLL